jgi:hypothetical protein
MGNKNWKFIGSVDNGTMVFSGVFDGDNHLNNQLASKY